MAAFQRFGRRLFWLESSHWMHRGKTNKHRRKRNITVATLRQSRKSGLPNRLCFVNAEQRSKTLTVLLEPPITGHRLANWKKLKKLTFGWTKFSEIAKRLTAIRQLQHCWINRFVWSSNFVMQTLHGAERMLPRSFPGEFQSGKSRRFRGDICCACCICWIAANTTLIASCHSQSTPLVRFLSFTRQSLDFKLCITRYYKVCNTN